MKIYRKTCSVMSIICLCLCLNSAWADVHRRAFTAANGRRIMGHLTQYNPADQIATIQRDDGHVFEVHLKLLSKTDQKYIRQYGPEINFDTLQISSKLKKFNGAARRDDGGQVKTLAYVVSLKNNSPSAFEKIEVEYCVFYSQGKRHKEVMVIKNGVRYGRWELQTMQPGSEYTFETESILILEEKSTCTAFGNTGGARGNVAGIWMRVTALLPTGVKPTRDILSPTLEKSHKWVPTDIPVGLNIPSR